MSEAGRVIVVVLLGLLLLGVSSCGKDAPPSVKQPVAQGQAPEPPPWPELSKEQHEEAERLKVPVKFENELGMRFVLIPAGKFMMGSPKDERERADPFSGGWTPETLARRGWPEDLDLEPEREVTLASPFYVQITEVTLPQYTRFDAEHLELLGRTSTPAERREWLEGEQWPAVAVEWPRAVAFAEWLTKTDGERAYRLPKETEWEYACRAGTKTRFFWGDELDVARRYANVIDEWPPPRLPHQDGETYTPVGSVPLMPVARLSPNPWGLYDMLGNLSEWCEDTWKGQTAPYMYPQWASGEPRPGYHPIRGGAHMTNTWQIPFRCAARTPRGEQERAPDVGFRLVSPISAEEE